jgi:hypothetical protein
MLSPYILISAPIMLFSKAALAVEILTQALVELCHWLLRFVFLSVTVVAVQSVVLTQKLAGWILITSWNSFKRAFRGIERLPELPYRLIWGARNLMAACPRICRGIRPSVRDVRQLVCSFRCWRILLGLLLLQACSIPVVAAVGTVPSALCLSLRRASLQYKVSSLSSDLNVISGGGPGNFQGSPGSLR